MNPQPEAPRSARGVFPVVAACFFLSGAAALLYEVVWMRLLGTVFGHTVHAVTTVLAAYMGGLALGSLLAGRWADRLARPLRAYGLLEAVIGGYCVATPWLFRATEAIYLWAYRALEPGALGSGVLHFVLAAAILLPPTTLMGATLPVLSRAVVKTEGVAASLVGTLYAINTWGAVAGVAATGFVLLPAIGLRMTVWLGVALNVLVAIFALALDRRAWSLAAPEPLEQAPAPVERTAGHAAPRSGGRVAVVLVAIAISGAASMSYEIAWTRALSMALGSSTYGFSAMLTTFLVGLALGALLVSRWLRRRAPGLAALGLLEATIAVVAVVTLPLFGRLPEALLLVLGKTGVTYGSALAAQFALSFLVMIGPTLLIGMTFPLAIAAVGTELGRLGRDVGVVYSANTLGTIVGSMGAGFLLIPAIGIQNTVILGAAANLLVGLAVVSAARPRGWVRATALAAAPVFVVAAVALPRWDPRMMTSGVPVYAAEMVKGGVAAVRASRKGRDLLLYAEGLSCTVAVARSATSTSLSVNGKTDAGTGRDMVTQLLLGHLGAILHPAPRRALVIGLASGITAGAMAQHPLEAIDVAELEPAMKQAARFFEKENRNVLADPRVRVLEGDGRQILAAAAQPYDLIVSEPSNPWIAGVASLFTREFYESARRKLAPGGVMVQWLQAYSIFSSDMQMVVRTFQEVFPHVSVWEGSLGDVLLVATPETVKVDHRIIDARLRSSPGIREDFERYRWTDGGLVFRFFLGEDDVRRYSAGAPLNTDDLPRLEFSAPLALYGTSAVENKAFMRSFRRVDRPAVLGLDPSRFDGPTGRLRSARELWREGRMDEAEDELSRAPPEGLDARERLERARLLFALGRFDTAWMELDGILRERPGEPTAATFVAVLQALSSPDQAARVERTAVWIRDRPYAERGALGDVILELGMARGDPAFLSVALEQLAAALELDPGKTALLNSYGVALAASERLPDATAAFLRALEINPDDARTHFNLGTLREREGRLQDAVAAYREAARLAPGWAPPRQRLAAFGMASSP